MTLDISLYGIVDPQIGKGRSLATLARAAADGGTTLIQYRAKAADTRAMIAEARAIVAALAGTDVPLLVNDRVDVALASGAQGVHLGREDMHPADARALLGPKAIIGATVKNRDDLLALRGQPIDYACIGGVFATSHKDNPDPPLGLDGFRALRAEARDLLGDLPVGAIAGITAANAGALIEAGADGVAVIGALFGGDDPLRAAKAFVPILRRPA
ncbi:MAG: thiamine phosphate synthase [Methylobacterium sp.]|nr:MAG: thiamine phosphate synthase [Methylobacterium sp.]